MEKINIKTRLGKRLTALFDAIPQDVTHLYDLCCDHGALGRATLETYPNSFVTFNDIHPDIMARLDKMLNDFNARNYTMSVMPAENLTVTDQGKPCIILAGVGDEQCITILKSLLAQKLPPQTHFIVSPATKTHFVRSFLASMPINVKQDQVTFENKRCYEIIEFSLDKPNNEPMHLFGTGWVKNDPDHIKHIEKILSFYRAQLENNPKSSRTNEIILGYEKILKKIKLES
jgi:tRNA (adenine22-N1)-methyltransferase